RLAKPKDPVKTYTVEQLLTWVRGKNARDWRISWFEAQLAFAQGDLSRAQGICEGIAQEIPGEIAPKLALGVVQEKLGNLDEALRYYDLVSTVSPSYTGAAFGLGRVLAARHDRAGAVKAYLRVPATSNRYLAALTDLVRVILDPAVAPVGKDEILQAADVLGRMRVDDTLLEPHQIAANLCCTAAELVEKGSVRFSNGETFLGTRGAPRELRRRAETEFRSCARIANDQAARVAFVDQANAVRPRTLF
ncbi:MAG TPA: tetratricopeptide repeat protein, partial [Chloroflexota bacterium]|nr:tetratricopeptide repeat protein [Chloroflexota bacterium]